MSFPKGETYRASPTVLEQYADLFDQLRREKDRTARLTAGAPYGIIAIDADSLITDYNPQAQAILGYAPDEVLGRRVDMLYDDTNAAIRINNLLRRSPDGRVTNVETIIRAKPDAFHPQGERIPARLDATLLLDADGRREGSVGYFEDLRAIKDIERRLALLLDAGKLIVQAQGLEDALDQLAGLLVKQLRVDFGRVFLLDEDAATLPPGGFVYPAGRAEAARDPHPGPARQPDLAAALAAAQAGGPQCVVRFGSPDALSAWQSYLSLDTGLESLLLIPLRGRNQAVGLLCLGDRRPRSPALFDDAPWELAEAVAGQTSALIDTLRLQEETRRHRDLLHALHHATGNVRAESHTDRLMPEIVRQAAELVDLNVGALYRHNPHLGILTLEAVHNLPPAWKGRGIPLADDLIGQVAATGQWGVAFDYLLTNAADSADAGGHPVRCDVLTAFPLKLAGDVVDVLVVGHVRVSQVPLAHAPVSQVPLAHAPVARRLRRVELEILEQFAAHASLALRYAQVLNREQRTFRQLDNLYKINKYLQTTRHPDKLWAALLTGITAGYCLGYNRAALFLLDETTGRLDCRDAIGPVSATEARQDWEQSRAAGLFNVANALTAIDRGKLKPTPFKQRIDGLSLPLPPDMSDFLGRILTDGHCLPLEGDQLAALPEALRAAFDIEPTTPLILTPLTARGRPIGLIVADNKYTNAPITEDDTELIDTFVGFAAIAIDNARRLEEQDALRRAADRLAGAAGLTDVLNAIVEEAQRGLRAASAAFWFYDHDSKRFILEQSFAAGIEPKVWKMFLRAEPQPGTTAFTVLERGRLDVEDVTDAERYPLFGPATRGLLGGIGVRSMQGIALIAHGQPMGVLYVNYAYPRVFSAESWATLQTYADYAATALAKARVMDQLHKARDTARVIADVMATADLDGALQAIVRGVRDVLRCGPVVLYVYDAGKKQLRYPPTFIDVDHPAEMQRLTAVRSDSIIHRLLRRGGVIIVPNTADDPLFANSRFTHDEEIVSLAAVVLEVDHDRVGIMFINYKSEHRFTGDEVENIEHFANDAAVAIRMALYREQVTSQANALLALREVGRMLTATRDQDKILAVAAEQARRLTPKATYASVSLLDADRLTPVADRLTPVATAPPERLPHLKRVLEEHRRNAPNRRGVTHRAIQSGETQRVPDVSKDNDYISYGPPPEGSELVVLLKVGERIIGTINIEHPQPYAFHDLEQSALEALAQEVGAAIAIADHIAAQERANRELRRKRRQLALAQTAILFRNLEHFMGNRVRQLAELLQTIEGKIDAARSETAVPTIRGIAKSIRNMRGDVADLQQALRVADMREEIRLLAPQEFLNAYLSGYGRALNDVAGLSVNVHCEIDDPAVRVRAGLDGMLMIFAGIVANAVEAMESTNEKRLTLAARRVKDEVHFLITDTGKGIDPAILQHLYTGDLPPRAGRKGHQIGLALAAALVEASYRGRMPDPETGPAGTTIIIALPIAYAP